MRELLLWERERRLAVEKMLEEACAELEQLGSELESANAELRALNEELMASEA